MPRIRRVGWIDWTKSDAKQVIMNDLQNGILSIDAAEVSAEAAWDVYTDTAEFSDVLFEQFKERLRDHRRKVRGDMLRATSETEALAHDRGLFPRQTENNRGEIVFDLSPAKELLRADVAEGKHNRMTPSQLQHSRVEYHPFDSKKFKHRIYQEVRRVKFLNYLNQKRLIKATKQKKEAVKQKQKKEAVTQKKESVKPSDMDLE